MQIHELEVTKPGGNERLRLFFESYSVMRAASAELKARGYYTHFSVQSRPVVQTVSNALGAVAGFFGE
jgi:hypothetical protein